MQEAKRTLIRVIALIWLIAAAVAVVGTILSFLFPFALLPYILGDLLGSTVSMLLMIHRYSTLDVELDMNRKSAVNHSKVMASLRAVAALAALFAAFYLPQWFSPVSVFAGLFATKAAALLYPIVFRTKCLSDEKAL